MAPTGLKADPLRGQLLQMIRYLLPGNPVLDAATREDVERDVVDFVADQISGMPGYLRLPYLCLLFTFEWLPALGSLRRFSSLPAARQRSYLAWWSGNRVSLCRDTIKLVRSCALLQFLDHHLVVARLEAMDAEEWR